MIVAYLNNVAHLNSMPSLLHQLFIAQNSRKAIVDLLVALMALLTSIKNITISTLVIVLVCNLKPTKSSIASLKAVTVSTSINGMAVVNGLKDDSTGIH